MWHNSPLTESAFRSTLRHGNCVKIPEVVQDSKVFRSGAEILTSCIVDVIYALGPSLISVIFDQPPSQNTISLILYSYTTSKAIHNIFHSASLTTASNPYFYCPMSRGQKWLSQTPHKGSVPRHNETRQPQTFRPERLPLSSALGMLLNRGISLCHPQPMAKAA